MRRKQASFTDRRRRIKKALEQLDELIIVAEDNRQEIVLVGHLTNLLVLRLSGTLEYSVGEAIKLHLDRCSNQEIARFVEVSTDRLMNLDATKLENLLAKFSGAWASKLATYLNTDENRQLLNTLIGKRNALAHGGSCTVRRDEVYRYRSLIEGILRVILECMDPRGAGDSAAIRDPSVTLQS